MALLKTRVKFPGVASGTQMPSPWAPRTLQMPHCQGLTIWANVQQLPRGEEMGTDRIDWYINAWAIPRLVLNFRGWIQMLQHVYKHPDIFTWESPASPHTHPLPQATTPAWKGVGCARFYTMVDCFPENVHTLHKEIGNSKGKAILRGIWGVSNQWTLCERGKDIYWNSYHSATDIISLFFFFWCCCKQTGDTE